MTFTDEEQEVLESLEFKLVKFWMRMQEDNAEDITEEEINVITMLEEMWPKFENE